MPRFLIVLLLLFPASLVAQAATGPDRDKDTATADEDMRARMLRMERQLADLRSRVEQQEGARLDQELRSKNLVNLYGDIGLRYHMLFESGTETFNRPEFRLHLGVYGTAFDDGDQDIRYDLRMTTFALDSAGRPVPAIAWLPFPGFGATPTLGVDRFLIGYRLGKTVGVTAGRFPSPFTGSEVMFDRDYNFQGLSQFARVDELFSPVWKRYLPRFEFVSVQSYMAQNNLGLPAIENKTPPIYAGVQMRLDFAPFESPQRREDGTLSPELTSEFEFRFVAGVHWYDGEEKVSQNLGVGYLPRTTNFTDSGGKVLSDFLIGEAWFEIVVLRTRRARISAWFHGLLNFHAKSHIDGRLDRNDKAFEAGISWGMERLDQRWDFLALFRYFYIEADALIPEFNSETLNTNIKGWEVELSVRIFPTLTLVGLFALTEREDHELNGFGLPADNDPNRAGGQSLRVTLGIYLDF